MYNLTFEPPIESSLQIILNDTKLNNSNAPYGRQVAMKHVVLIEGILPISSESLS